VPEPDADPTDVPVVMRIRFLVLNAYAKGGTARTTLDTASRLAARHEVEVVSVNRFRRALNFEVDPRVRVRCLVDRRDGRESPLSRRLARIPSGLETLSGNRDPRLSLLSDIRLAREIRGMRTGLLIGTRPSISLAIARFARPSVYTLGQEHQYLQAWRPSVQRAIGRGYRRLDAVTAVTAADAASHRAVLADVMVTAMPNAVPVMGSERSDGSSKLVVTAGRLTHAKGFDLLIAGFRTVAERHPDWSLHIYGSGDWHDRLARQIHESGLDGTVTLKGFSRSLQRDLAEASIFAMSSRYEGFSLALVEAMAVGLPPVAFACPQGPIEIIDDGVDGLLVPPQDTKALASAICSLIENPGLRAELAAAARRSVQRYSPGVVDERWEQLIEAMTAQPPGLRRKRLVSPR
jgi:glycosyltransferase involved in cell wall biosynthesis